MEKGLLELGNKTSEAELFQALPLFPSELPEEYIDFISKHDGASGDLPVKPYYFQLWQIKEILGNNQDYEIQQYLPNYFGIGGNGGGELLALNLKNQKIYALPFVPMNEEAALLVSESFDEFEDIMGFTEETES